MKAAHPGSQSPASAGLAAEAHEEVKGRCECRSEKAVGTSLVVQWLRLYTPNAGGPGLIPGLGTRSHMLQLKV